MRRSALASALVLSALCPLSACNSHHDGDGGEPAPAETTVTGVAAIGAPLVAAAVDLHCVDGSTHATSTNDAGAWTLDVPSAALPCLVRVSGGSAGAGDNTASFYSLAGSTAASVVANITPLADLEVALAANLGSGSTPGALFDAATATQLQQLTGLLDAARDALLADLQSAGYALPSADFDPLASTIDALSASDAYDALLEAYAQALAAAGRTYAEARENYLAGAGLPSAATTPPDQARLPAATLGVAFTDSRAGHTWLQPSGVGGVTAIDGDGDGIVSLRMGDGTQGGPDGTVQILNLPNQLGTFHCGDTVGSGILQMKVSFNGVGDPTKAYVSSADGTTTLDGYDCSVTVTKVDRFASRYVYGDGLVEGAFTANLRQQAADCAGEGACSPFATLAISSGEFRIDKSGVYPSEPPPAGTLAARIGTAFAGSYVVSCPSDSGNVEHTITIAADGSSTVDGVAAADATHGGTVSVKGRGVAAGRNDSGQTWPSFLLQFTDSGALQSNAYNTVAVAAGAPKFCTGVSGSIDPSAYDHAAVSAVFARTATLDCTARNALGGALAASTPQGSTTFTLAGDGSYTLGQLTLTAGDYKPYAQYEAIDRATFPSFGNDRLVSAGNGSIKLALQMAADGTTTSVSFQNGYDSGTCSP